jgi:hypothetical protein
VAAEHERSILSSRVDAAAGAARVARYAEAIVASDGDVLGRRAIDAVARAVVAVADEERVELRAEVERLRAALQFELDDICLNGEGAFEAHDRRERLRTVLDKHTGEQAQGGEGA